MQTFITIIYIIVALVMVLSILLQSGKGGGMGSALGGGASQGVFGGGGGADFMSKLTQGFAATFMICAMYLAYASAHAGSEFLEEEDKGAPTVAIEEGEINYEFIGPNPQLLPTPEEGKAKQAKASAIVPAQSDAPDAAPADAVPADAVPADAAPAAAVPADAGESPEANGAPGTVPGQSDDANVDRGDSPEEARGESPQRDKESLQDPPASDDGSSTEKPDTEGSD